MRAIVPASLICFLSCEAFGQSAQAPSFEAATIKSAAPSDTKGGRTSISGDRAVYSNRNLAQLIAYGFAQKFGDQVAGPSWITTERYDIVAKARDNTPKELMPLMLRNLLVERFKLVLHQETKEFPAYALILGKGRLRLEKVEGSKEQNSWSLENGRREARSMGMAALAITAGQMLQTPVLDMTGLQGYYNFPFDQTMEETRRDSAPSVFTLLEDLGLKLEARKAPFNVVVIESGNKVPTEN